MNSKILPIIVVGALILSCGTVLLAHHDDSCDECDAYDYNPYGYTYTYKCSTCGMTFTDSTAYLDHVAAHSNDYIKSVQKQEQSFSLWIAIIGVILAVVGIYFAIQFNKKRQEDIASSDEDISKLRDQYLNNDEKD